MIEKIDNNELNLFERKINNLIKIRKAATMYYESFFEKNKSIGENCRWEEPKILLSIVYGVS